MAFIQGELYHIYNRGNNRKTIFFNEDNYLFFLRKIQKHLSPCCDILAYCLMPNHFHLLVRIKADHKGEGTLASKTASNALGICLRSYTRAIQNQEHFTGSLFQQKTRSRQVEDLSNSTISGLLICMNYIHYNPVKANLVKGLGDWQFSSYHDYTGPNRAGVCNIELGYDLIGISKKEFIEQSEEIIRDQMTLVTNSFST